MKNYYNKQRDNLEERINYLYKTKDITFRGFRFNVDHSSLQNFKPKNKKDNYSIEGTKNWENSMTGDGERFSQQLSKVNGNKSKKSYEIYLKRKAKTAAEKKVRKQKVLSSNETSSLYTNFHGQTRS